MQTTILTLTLALLGVTHAQSDTHAQSALYTSKVDGVKTCIGNGFRCYAMQGKVKHVETQKNVQAIFYDNPGCTGAHNVQTWGYTTLDDTFTFNSVELKAYDK